MQSLMTTWTSRMKNKNHEHTLRPVSLSSGQAGVRGFFGGPDAPNQPRPFLSLLNAPAELC
jgi:hypothetical protein